MVDMMFGSIALYSSEDDLETQNFLFYSYHIHFVMIFLVDDKRVAIDV